MMTKKVYARVDEMSNKRSGMHSGYFASLKDAVLYIKQTIREHGPPQFVLIDAGNGSRAFEISFSTKAKEIDEIVRVGKPVVSYLALSRERRKFCLRLRWSFYQKRHKMAVQQYQERRFAEIGPAIELFQRFERNLGAPKKVVLFDFKDQQS